MKKFLIIMLFVTISIAVLVLVNIDTNKPSASATTTYTRKELQDYVVSTAASYYYNNIYTDYEGHWAEISESNYSSVYDVSPEELSRSKRTTMQCINYVANSYIYSFGFDFSKYKNSLVKSRYTRYSVLDSNNNQSYVYAIDSNTKYKNTYLYFSKIYSCKYMNTIAKDNYSKKDPMVILTYQKDGYNGAGINTFINGIGTNVDITTLMTDSRYSTQKSIITNALKSNLQPGDIYINDHHAMLYVGDIFEEGGGMLHSSGSSFLPGKQVVNNDNTGSEPVSDTDVEKPEGFRDGYDSFSVRYSSYDFILDSQVTQNKNKVNTVVTILRPINIICKKWSADGKTCTELNSDFVKLNPNVKARTKLKYLKTEQYVYNEADKRDLSANTASVNKGDILTYRINMKNMSKISFCSTGKKTNEKDCKSEGGTWKTINKNKTYSSIIINAKIPEGTTFVSCNNSCFCYDKNDRIVKCSSTNKNLYWKLTDFKPGNEKEYSYNVKVKTDISADKVVNTGTRIKYDGSVLTMGKITIFVNSTINGVYKDKVVKIVDTDIKNNKTCSNSLGYAISIYDSLFKDEKIKRSVTDDLSSLLTPSNILNAHFKKINKTNAVSYTRKSDDEKSKLTGAAKKVSNMIVPYLYGGKLYEKVYYADRMKDEFYTFRPLSSIRLNLNVGDIVVTMNNTKNGFVINNAVVYLGDTTFEYCKGGKPFKHSYNTNLSFKNGYAYLLNEIYSSDLYVVLRPSKYYNIRLTDNFSIKSDFITGCPEGYNYDKSNKKCTKTIDYYKSYTYDDYGLKDYPYLERNGYTQIGWKVYTYNSKTKKYDVSTNISGSTAYKFGYTIYPVWQEKHTKIEQVQPPVDTITPIYPEPMNNETTIMLDPQDKELGIIEVHSDTKGWTDQNGTIITEVSIPTKEDYAFEGYYTEKDGQGTLIIDSNGNFIENNETLDKDTVLYANWVKVNDSTLKPEESTKSKLVDDILFIVQYIAIMVAFCGIVYGSMHFIKKKKIKE